MLLQRFYSEHYFWLQLGLVTPRRSVEIVLGKLTQLISPKGEGLGK